METKTITTTASSKVNTSESKVPTMSCFFLLLKLKMGKSILSSCLNKTKNPVVCVFQPHTYSRTKSLIKKFCSAFLGVESLILVETYSAREKYDFLGSCENLKETIEKECKKIKTYGVFSKKQVVGFLRSYDLKGKTLLFLGAGDIEDVVKKFKTKFIT